LFSTLLLPPFSLKLCTQPWSRSICIQERNIVASHFGILVKLKQSSPTARHESPWGRGIQLLLILDLSTLYLRGKDPQHTMDRRLGGSQSRSGHMLEEESSVFAGDQTPIAQSSSP
jgi:hypothetical protein